MTVLKEWNNSSLFSNSCLVLRSKLYKNLPTITIESCSIVCGIVERMSILKLNNGHPTTTAGAAVNWCYRGRS